MTEKIRRAYPYILFLALVCIFLWKPIFTGRALLPGDYLAQMKPWSSVITPAKNAPQWNPLQWDAIAQFYPWRVFYARSMETGNIPLWNPYQFSGTPFLANGQSAVLYPLNLIFLIVDPVTGFTIFAALHLFLALVFMYLFLRGLKCSEVGSIAGAIVFTFSAFTVLWLELPTFISSAVWLPLALWLINKAVDEHSLQFGMLSGVVLALSILAGHFQIAFYVIFTAIFWWLWLFVQVMRSEHKSEIKQRAIIPFIGCIVILALISAPQFIPTRELANNSHRVREVTSAGYTRFIGNAAHPYRLITAFLPNYYGNPSTGDYFLGSAADYIEYGLYAGVFPLLLALSAVFAGIRKRYVGFFAVLALFSFLVAIGTPVNALFYYLVPGFSALGGPNRILLLFFFALAGLTAFGMDFFIEYSSEKLRLFKKDMTFGFAIAGCVVIVYVIAFILTQSMAAKFLAAIIGRPIGLLVERDFAAFLLGAIFVMLARSQSQISPKLFAWLAVVLITADLFSFGINYNPTCERSKVYPKTELTTKLREIAGHYRIAPINPEWSLYKTPNAILPPNAAMVYGLYDVQGYDSLYTKAYKDFSSAIQGQDSSPIENGNMILFKRCTRDVSMIAPYVVSSDPITNPSVDVISTSVIEGIYVTHVGINNPLQVSKVEKMRGPYKPFSFRFGLFLMCIGISVLCSVIAFNRMKLVGDSK